MPKLVRSISFTTLLSCIFLLSSAYAALPELLTPTAGASFESGNQSFTWVANDNSVQRWNLRIGSKVGRADYFKSSNLTGSETGVIVSDLPADARKLYVRLRYKIAGVWAKQDYVYYAAGENNLPTITGSPRTRVNVGKVYTFRPTSTEVDRETKTFSISNQPLWATFDSSKGKLTGAPAATDAGLYENIVISVSDERGGTVSLPAFSIDVNSVPVISGAPATKAVVGQYYEFSPTASDADGDSLVFRRANKPSWAKFNNKTGVLSGTPTADDIGTTNDIRIRVKDNNGGVATLPLFNISVTELTAVERALQSGVVTDVTDVELLNAALNELESKQELPALLSSLYGSEAISYKPSNRTQLLNIDPWIETVSPIIVGNKGKTLALAGTTENSRYAAYGMSPTELFGNGDTAYEVQFGRVLSWLLTGNTTTDVTSRTVALSNAASDHGNIRAWFADKHPTWVVKDCNVAAELTACYASADLIMTGWQGSNADTETIRQALAVSMEAGKPVLYVHTWYEAYNDVAHTIADLLNFSLPYGGNFWSKDTAVWNNAAEMQTAIWQQQGLAGVETMLNHFKDNNYNFDWGACDGEDCSKVVDLESDFQLGATKVREMMVALDTAKIDLFSAEDGPRLLKLLALIGDKYRLSVSYPMDKVTTSDNDFLKSYYADHAVYNFRRVNPAQVDMGNFSRSDFSHITPVSKTINVTSKQYFRSTGAYALPGQTVRVTRQDSSDLSVKVFVNTLRSGATHQWAKNGYKRPKYLQSPQMEIESGETISFTSPYGGPLQLRFSENDLPVVVRFENVGEHPHWAASEDDTSFAQKLAAGDYDWAELVTPGFEVHSKLDKMRTSMSDSKWGSAEALAAATMRYMHNLPHVLAGFSGPGIDVVSDIHDFATSKGFTMDNLDKVKHMNADQASCGYGCSGNPYDAYWAYSPVGHGDVHELGHGLQGGMRFKDWENHSMTNYYSYYTKSKFYQATGQDPICQSLSFEQAFSTLQASVNQDDAAAYMKENWWTGSNWKKQATMFIQMMMAAQADSSAENTWALQDGWHLRARLHVIEREFNRANDSEASWTEKREALGFGAYSLEDATALYNRAKNDWLLIALSTATGKDFRDYLTMWGIDFSDTAAAQVAAMSYTSIPRNFFVSSADGFCRGEGFDGTSLAVDGESEWP